MCIAGYSIKFGFNSAKKWNVHYLQFFLVWIVEHWSSRIKRDREGGRGEEQREGREVGGEEGKEREIAGRGARREGGVEMEEQREWRRVGNRQIGGREAFIFYFILTFISTQKQLRNNSRVVDWANISLGLQFPIKQILSVTEGVSPGPPVVPLTPVALSFI